MITITQTHITDAKETRKHSVEWEHAKGELLKALELAFVSDIANARNVQYPPMKTSVPSPLENVADNIVILENLKMRKSFQLKLPLEEKTLRTLLNAMRS